MDVSKLPYVVIATDTLLFTIANGTLLVRLTRVHRPPQFSNASGFPGGLIVKGETAELASLRHLRDKAHIDPEKIYSEQLYTFSDIDRDPRGRVVAVAYLALVPWNELRVEEQAATEDAWWAPVNGLKGLAYDHDDMLKVALARLRTRITYTTLASKFMPKEFTLSELETAFEAVVSKDLDKRNFRKKLHKLGVLRELSKKRTGAKHRPATLYSFRGSKVIEIEVL
jgi:8-oxo-dGTP diphosphatase